MTIAKDFTAPYIQQPLSRERALSMLHHKKGTIDVVIGLDWNDARLPVEHLDNLVQHLIVADEFTFGYTHGITYNPCGWDIAEKKILVEVTADVDPEEWQEEEDVEPYESFSVSMTYLSGGNNPSPLVEPQDTPWALREMADEDRSIARQMGYLED